MIRYPARTHMAMAMAMAIALGYGSAATVQAAERWAIIVGETTLTLHPRATATHDLWIEPLGAAADIIARDADNLHTINFLVDPQSDFVITYGADGATEFRGTIMHYGGLAVGGPQGQRLADTFLLSLPEGLDNKRAGAGGSQDRSTQAFILSGASVQFDRVAQTLLITSDYIVLSPEWAAALHQPELAKESIGSIVMRAALTSLDGDDVAVVSTVSPFTDPTTAGAVIGPDVIVGLLPSVGSFGSIGGIAAFSVGTTSCNTGDVPLMWIASTNEHPVIAQNMYRLKDNRFEHIGQSWLKHGFFALQGNDCQLGCTPTPSTRLGVGCSDPYNAGLNGQQGNLRQRSEVNAFTGSFVYPGREACDGCPLIERRLQVHVADLDPALNPESIYFVEGHYVAADDALAGNGENNASYRKIAIHTATDDQFSPCPPNINAGEFCAQVIFGTTTQREQPAIRAWKAHDATVVETEVRVPAEGLFLLSAKAINVGNGNWEYEYALQNLNSHRSCGSFSLPLPVGSVILDAGFHDVDYHSGEPYDGADWTITTTDSVIIWSTISHGTNASANALRWGTLYNFRFRTNVAPGDTTVTLGLFRPGSPNAVTATTIGPAVGLADCNDNGAPDSCDLNCEAVGCVPPCGGSVDCNRNGVPDECEPDCNGNGIVDACDISGGTSTDCQPNGVPDSCEADCDGDGIPDDCDTPDDCDGDGIEDCNDFCRCSSDVNACLCPQIDICCWIDTFGCQAGWDRDDCLATNGTPGCTESPCNGGCMLTEINGDIDRDGDSDAVDSAAFYACYSGTLEVAAFVEPSVECLARFDYDGNHAIDLDDFKQFQANLSGP